MIESKFYSQYISEVLGVKSILVPHDKNMQTQTASFEASVWKTELIHQPQADGTHCREVLTSDLLGLIQNAKIIFLSLLSSSKQTSIFEMQSYSMLKKMQKAMQSTNEFSICIEFMGSHKGEFWQEILNWKGKRLVLFSTTPDRKGVMAKNDIVWIETFSPQHLLQNPSEKRLVWEDLQLIDSKTGLASI